MNCSVDNVYAMMMTDWRTGWKIVRTVLCCIVYDNFAHTQA